MRGSAAAILAFVLAACTTSVASPSPVPSFGIQGQLEVPDSSLPAAGICMDPWPGDIATFTLAIDTPQPRCGKVRASQRLRVVNATGTNVTVTLHGVDYVLEPGADETFPPRFGAIWELGVHVLHTSFYGGGGGPDIWFIAG